MFLKQGKDNVHFNKNLRRQNLLYRQVHKHYTVLHRVTLQSV